MITPPLAKNFGHDHPMLIATLAVTDYHAAKDKLYQLQDQADGIELRLDYASHWDKNAVAALREACTLPMIMTLRSSKQGGYYPHAEAQRLQTLLDCCALNPDYLDLEYDVPIAYIQDIRQCYPEIKIILSYHNFKETPSDLEALFRSIQRADCYAYKIATQAHSVLDALRMVQWVMARQSQHRVVGLCMGEAGQCTRILAPVMGSFFCYACWDSAEATAPGQLSLQTLTTTYRYHQLNRGTKIYALLGDPVQRSLGHILHNDAMARLEQNAVYIKLPVTHEALPEVMSLIRQLPFWGLSITMPLKEAVVPLLDGLDVETRVIGAVNTVVRTPQQQWLGFNSDGLGAMQALSAQISLTEQTVVILGAGGAARAIAYAVVRQSAKVIILNRSLDRAETLANELGCEAYALDVFPTLSSYTVCINTLPDKAYQDPQLQRIWKASHILPGTRVMDIVYQPIETEFLRTAKVAGCPCIPGFQMFIAQAVLQIRHWFQPNELELQTLKTRMFHFFVED